MNIRRTTYESTGENAPTPHRDDPRFAAHRMAYHRERKARILGPWLAIAAILSTAWLIYTIWQS